LAGGKNFIINGNFDFFQRGSFSGTTQGYSLDRWYAFVNGNATITQQTTGAPIGSQYVGRVAYNSTTNCNMWQFIESGTLKAFQGNTVTVSAKFRRNSTFAGSYNLAIFKSSTANGGAGATWTSMGSTSISNANLPTGTTSSSWATATFTTTIPTDGTAEGLTIVCYEGQNQSSGAYIEIAQVQLELGSVATAFSRAGGTLQGELAACQRYYWRQSTASAQYGFGFAISATASKYIIKTPVTMRTTPTVLDVGAGVNVGDLSTYNFATTSLVIYTSGPDTVRLDATVSSGQTAYRPQAIFGASGTASDYLGFGAEL
jgi:hypothetical protein